MDNGRLHKEMKELQDAAKKVSLSFIESFDWHWNAFFRMLDPQYKQLS